MRLWIVVALLGLCAIAQAADIDRGTAWLASTQQPSGALAGSADGAHAYQGTAEAVDALARLSAYPVVRQRGAAYLAAAGFDNSEWLARRILAVASEGGDAQPWLAQLRSHQSADGGFADEPGGESTVFDTAWALRGLAAGGDFAAPEVGPALGWLLARQDAAGVWRDRGEQSAVVTTARALHALWLHRHSFDLGSALARGRSALLGLREAGGGWGSPLATALALEAVLPGLATLQPVAADLALLDAGQSDNGSWSDDVHLTALALRVLAAAEAGVPNPDLAQVRGRLLDATDDMPLANAEVLLDDGEFAATTGADGRFEFHALNAGGYRISAQPPGYRRLTGNFGLGAGQALDLGDLRLSVETGAATGVTVTGVARRAGNPPVAVANARITVGTLEARSAANGRYTLTDVPPGTLRIEAFYNASHTTLVAEAIAQAGDTVLFDPLFQPRATVPLARLELTIVSADTQLPIAAARLTLGGANSGSFVANAQGRISTTLAAEGVTTLRVGADGHGTATAVIDANGGQTYASTIALQPGTALPTSLSGVVTDDDSGAPLEGVRMSLAGAFVAEVLTDADGAYRFDGLGAGDVQLRATLAGYRDHHQTLALEDNVGYRFDLPLRAAAVPPEDAWRIEGQVVDIDTGMPLVAASLFHVEQPSHQSGESHSGLGGLFRIEGLADRSLLLTVSADGYDTRLMTVQKPVVGDVLNLGFVRLQAIGAWLAQPDLVPATLDRSGLAVDAQTWQASGTLGVPVRNQGPQAAGQFHVAAFLDVDGDNDWTPGVDRIVAEASAAGLAPGAQTTLVMAIDGVALPFRDAAIFVRVDSRDQIIESIEGNNLTSTGLGCGGAAQSLDLALCMDGSGSVGTANFRLQLEGLAMAISNPQIVPADGSVRLTVFAGNGANSNAARLIRGEPIEASTLPQLLDRIRGITSFSSSSSISTCARNVSDYLGALSPASSLRSVTVSGDGQWQGVAAAASARDYAAAAGVAVIDAIGVGSVNLPTLEASVYPQPPGGERGRVTLIQSSSEYAAAVSVVFAQQVANPDLSVGGLRVLDNGFGQPLSLVARVGNGGMATAPAGIAVRFHQGDPVDGGRLLGEIVLQALSPGRHVDLRLDDVLLQGEDDVYVTVDPDGTLAECNRGNNQHQAPVAAGNALARLQVGTDAAEYAPGSVVALHGRAFNDGEFAAHFSLRLWVVDAFGVRVAEFAEADLGTVAGGGQTLHEQDWPSASTLAGDYRLHGELLDAGGHAVAEDQAPFRLLPVAGGAPLASLDLRTDRFDYARFDAVEIASMVGNLSQNAALTDARLRLAVVAPDGSAGAPIEQPLSELLPGSRRQLDDLHRLIDAAVGDYRIDGLLLAEDGRVLAEDSAVFRVSAPRFDAEGLTGIVTLDADVVARGTPIQRLDRVSNTGAAALLQLPLAHVLATSEGEQILRVERAGDIAPGGADSFAQLIDTAGLVPGAYVAVLLAEAAPEDWVLLDEQGFNVVDGDLAALAGTVAVDPAEVQAGTPVARVDRVGNEGDLDLPEVRLSHRLLAGASAVEIARVDEVLALAAGGVHHWQTDIDSTALPPGTYVAVLQLEDGSVGGVELARASFRVHAPSAAELQGSVWLAALQAVQGEAVLRIDTVRNTGDDDLPAQRLAHVLFDVAGDREVLREEEQVDLAAGAELAWQLRIDTGALPPGAYSASLLAAGADDQWRLLDSRPLQIIPVGGPGHPPAAPIMVPVGGLGSLALLLLLILCAIAFERRSTSSTSMNHSKGDRR